MRNDHSPLPGGRFTGDSMSCTVLPSAATSAIAAATGVAVEPTIRSTLSSVRNLRVFCTALVGSVASSRTITLSFSPAMVAGQRAMPFVVGMPSAEVGPVSEMLTPIVMSACAAPAANAAARARARRIEAFMMSPVVVGRKGKAPRLFAQRPNVFGDRDRAQPVGILGVAADEGTRLGALAD